MNVSSVNQVKDSPIGKAAKVAGVVGALDLASRVGTDVLACKALLKLPKDIVADVFSRNPKEFIAEGKEAIDALNLPKFMKKIVDKSTELSPKNIKKIESSMKEIKNVIDTGKIDLKPILKRNAKVAAISAAIVGAITLGATVISKAVKAKKEVPPTIG